MKPARFAQDAARFIKSLERMEGIVTRDSPALVILSHPEHTTPERALVEHMLGFHEDDTPTTTAWIAQAIRAREVLEITPGRLGSWAHKLQLLQRSQGLAQLIRSGEGALRRYQHVDIQQLLLHFEARYHHLRTLHQISKIPEAAPLLDYLLYDPDPLTHASVHAHRRCLRDALAALWPELLPDDAICRTVLTTLMRCAGFCGDEGARSVAEETHAYNAYTQGARLDSPAMLAASAVPDLSQATLEELAQCGHGEEARWAIRACTQVGHLHGAQVAQVMVRDGMATLRAHMAWRHLINTQCEVLYAACETLSRESREGELPALFQHMRHEPHGPVLTREIARAFGQMLHAAGVPDTHCPSQTSLWRAVLEADTGHDPGEVAQIFWSMINVQDIYQSVPSDLSRTKAHCALMLTSPGLAMPGLSELDKKDTAHLSEILLELQEHKKAPLIGALIRHAKHGLTWNIRALLREATLDADELDLIMAHEFMRDHAEDVPRHATARRALMRCVKELAAGGLLEHLDVENGWLIRLFSHEHYAQDFNILTIARAIATTSSHSALASQIHGFCRATQRPSSTLARSFARWQDMGETRLAQRAQIDALTAKLLPRASQDPSHAAAIQAHVTRYLHHRRLLNEPEELSHNILKKLEDPVTHYAQQIAAISSKLAAEELTASARERLVERLEVLARGEHPDAEKKRLRSATNLLEQSLAQLEAQSLQRLLDDGLLQVLTQITGEPHHDAHTLTPELRSLLAVSQSEEFHPALFKRFLVTALGHTPRTALEENIAWQRTISHTAIDLARWEQGFRQETTHDNRPILIKTEHDLIRAAHMGSWFDTCLSLTDGFHAMSALAHPLSANTHVVYIENARGEVIARKLIAISTAHELIGYPLYARNALYRESLCATVDGAIEGFARRCGLMLSNEGKPCKIINFDNDSIYLDGVKGWHLDRHDATLLPQPPLTWSDDIDSQMEWALGMAHETQDHELMRAVAWRMRAPWCDYAAAALIEHDEVAARRWMSAHARGWDPPTPVVNAIWHRGDYSAATRHELLKLTMDPDDTWRPVEFALWNMPHEEALIEALARTLSRQLLHHERHPEAPLQGSHDEHIGRNPELLGHIPVARLLDMLDTSIVLYRRADHHDPWREEMAIHLQDTYLYSLTISWLKHGADELALCAMIRAARHADLVSVLAEFAREFTSEAVARALRARWRQHDTKKLPINVRIALLRALAAQDKDLAHIALPEEEPALLLVRSMDDLRAILLQVDAQGGRHKATRRALTRAIEATQMECRSGAHDQIAHQEVREAFEALIKSHDEDVDAQLSHFASLCHVVHQNQHDEHLARYRNERQNIESQRAQGGPRSLNYLRRIAQGPREARIQALLGEVARFERQGIWRIGGALWMLASDLADELPPDALVWLAHMSLPMNQLNYSERSHLDTFLNWMLHHPEPHEALTQWATHHARFAENDDADDTGTVALIDMLGHRDPQKQRLVSDLLVMFAQGASTSGNLALLDLVLPQYRAGVGLLCAERLLDVLFSETAAHGVLQPEELIAHYFPASTWRNPLSFSVAQRCVRRASKVWDAAMITRCRALLATRLPHNARAQAFDALWELLE